MEKGGAEVPIVPLRTDPYDYLYSTRPYPQRFYHVKIVPPAGSLAFSIWDFC